MLLLSSVLTLAGLAEPAADAPVTWAGHQVVFGQRRVPVLGTLKTRTDTYVLAQARREGDAVVLRQRACKVEVAPVAGVKVTMNAEKLPPNEMRFSPDDGALRSWAVHRWNDEDVDRDGNPGFTVRVDAPMCGGRLFVANRSVTMARAWRKDGALRGRHEVRVQQRVLGAEGACLSATAEDTDERVRGHFTYVPVGEDASCQSLLRQGWPVLSQKP